MNLTGFGAAAAMRHVHTAQLQGTSKRWFSGLHLRCFPLLLCSQKPHKPLKQTAMAAGELNRKCYSHQMGALYTKDRMTQPRETLSLSLGLLSSPQACAELSKSLCNQQMIQILISRSQEGYRKKQEQGRNFSQPGKDNLKNVPMLLTNDVEGHKPQQKSFLCLQNEIIIL